MCTLWPVLVVFELFEHWCQLKVLAVTELVVMAYFHQWTWIRIRTRIRIPNLMGTLYYAELFPLVWIWIPVWRVSWMVTVPILGTDLCPRDRSLSLFHTLESGDQSPNLNQWKNLHSTGIWIRVRIRIRLRWGKWAVSGTQCNSDMVWLHKIDYSFVHHHQQFEHPFYYNFLKSRV